MSDLRSQIMMGRINEQNVAQLRLLNSTILPVQYSDKFYVDVVKQSFELTKFAYMQGFVVGAVCSRIEDIPESSNKRVYIMTLAVVAAYRGRKIGTQLLEEVLEACEGMPEVSEIYLHVQTNNSEAVSFYKSFGFDIAETVENYYKRIDPPHAHILKRTFKRDAP